MLDLRRRQFITLLGGVAVRSADAAGVDVTACFGRVG
jgi:hypothetical protein